VAAETRGTVGLGGYIYAVAYGKSVRPMDSGL